MGAAPTAVEIFCSYANADEVWRQKLETHPSLLRRQGLFNQAIEALRAYSLVRRDPKENTLSIHRLVQAVLQGYVGRGGKALLGRTGDAGSERSISQSGAFELVPM